MRHRIALPEITGSRHKLKLYARRLLRKYKKKDKKK